MMIWRIRGKIIRTVNDDDDDDDNNNNNNNRIYIAPYASYRATAPLSNFRTFQVLKNPNWNFSTFQDPREPWNSKKCHLPIILQKSVTCPCHIWRPSVVAREIRDHPWLPEPHWPAAAAYSPPVTIPGRLLVCRSAKTAQCQSDFMHHHKTLS